MVGTNMAFAFIIFLFDFSLSSHFFNWFFLSPHNLSLSLSLPTDVLSSSDQIPSSSLNLKHLSWNYSTLNQTQKSSFFSLCTSNQTPIPSSKQNPEMESLQTKQIFILSEKEQRNRRWRWGRAWRQGRRSHEDQRASSKRGSWGRGPLPECSWRSCLSTTVKPDFYSGRARGVRVRIGSDWMEWNGFGCMGFFCFCFCFFVFVAIWVDLILPFWWVIMVVGLQ